MGKRITCNKVSYIKNVRGVYIGKIKNGQKNGWGLQINNNGNKYEGLFKNDEKYLFGLELLCCLCGHTYRNKVENGMYGKDKIHYKDVNNNNAYYNINHNNIYCDDQLNFHCSSENEFVKGNICIHENRYIYIGSYKKGKKHGKGILINYNNYFIYSCIFYKNKIIYVDLLFSNDQKYMNMKNIDIKHYYNTHNKKKIYLFLQKEYKNKLLGFINFYNHITHKMKKKQENVHDKITFLKCIKELFFVTHTNRKNTQIQDIIHTYKNYSFNKNDNTYNIFKEQLHKIKQAGNKTQHENGHMKTICRHAAHENMIIYNKRKENNKHTSTSSDEKKNKHTSTSSDEKKNKHTSTSSDEKKKKHTSTSSDEKKNKHTSTSSDEKKNKNTSTSSDEKKNKHTSTSIYEQKNKNTSTSSGEKKNGYLFLSDEIKTKYNMIENMKKKEESYTMINNNKKKEYFYNLKSMIYEEVEFSHNHSICDYENKEKKKNIEIPFFLKRPKKHNDIEEFVLFKNAYNKCYNLESGKDDIIYNYQKDKIKKDKLKVPFFFKEKGIYKFFNNTTEKKEDENIIIHKKNDEIIYTDKIINNIRTNDIPYNIIPNKRETIVDDINSCSNTFSTKSNTDTANSYHMNIYSGSNNFYENKKKKIKKRDNSVYSSTIKNKKKLYNDKIHNDNLCNNTCVCIKSKRTCSSFKINKHEKKIKENFKCNIHKKLKQRDKNWLFNNYIFNDNFLDNVFVLKPPMDEEGEKKNYDKLKHDTFPLFLRKRQKKKKLFQAQNYIYWNIYELNLFFFLVGIPKEILEIFINHRLDGYCLKYIDKKLLKEMKIENKMMRKYIYLCVQYLLRLREKYKYKKKSNNILNEKINEHFILKKNQLHILNLIGRGGYSNVYRCIYGNKNILRINKFFDIHYSINNTALKIFLNKKKNILEYFTELFIVSNLRHPNVTLFLGAINNPRAIVLEYVQYGTLFDILHRYKVKIKLQDIIKISKDIIAFMSFLHNKGIMHCDLKSSNILMSITRDIKICDFGLSVFNKYNKPKYLGIVGTYQWTAPEVLRSEGYTKEADIYSFGVILWEMIHRKIPFSEIKNPLDIIAHVGYTNKKLIVTDKNIPDQLRYILHSCLHKNKHKRKSFLFWSEYFDLLYNVTDNPKEDYTSFFFD
ncbi:tyrosine kinase-like protein, putative [Plasmodium sp. gorilla clade G2]|uniref:tyrosine kinase-like protein, putative n=1 Tax=Plasmodium sp. gorilla clade G2 TaxID=880535 RepID=UPI000D206C3C|nr:tyrosine kinase-like protein, putative [Plasmodium sp. gorilla clade G2]SOV10569.1 tyrosine kinase-like protein, putative [Plasmodium sp. gorilla clade G2]